MNPTVKDLLKMHKYTITGTAASARYCFFTYGQARYKRPADIATIAVAVMDKKSKSRKTGMKNAQYFLQKNGMVIARYAARKLLFPSVPVVTLSGKCFSALNAV